MLYPTVVPSRLADAEMRLVTEPGIAVVWDRGRTRDVRIGYVQLLRRQRGALRDDLRTARSGGYRPRRVRVGRRTVWRLCGHICGYEWIEDGRAYGVFGIYYIGDENGSTVARDQRSLIRALAPLVE